jgi:hypothetical protein
VAALLTRDGLKASPTCSVESCLGYVEADAPRPRRSPPTQCDTAHSTQRSPRSRTPAAGPLPPGTGSDSASGLEPPTCSRVGCDPGAAAVRPLLHVLLAVLGACSLDVCVGRFGRRYWGWGLRCAPRFCPRSAWLVTPLVTGFCHYALWCVWCGQVRWRLSGDIVSSEWQVASAVASVATSERGAEVSSHDHHRTAAPRPRARRTPPHRLPAPTDEYAQPLASRQLRRLVCGWCAVRKAHFSTYPRRVGRGSGNLPTPDGSRRGPGGCCM